MSNKSYIELLDKFENKNNVFILGAGPSLFETSKNSLFSKLKKYGIVRSLNINTKLGYSFNTNDYFCSPKYIKEKCLKVYRIV